MPTLGTVCNHPRCSEIEVRLYRGETLHVLSRAYGLSRSAFSAPVPTAAP